MFGVIALDDARIKPNRWRKQHGRIEAVAEQIQDADGNIGDPYRALSVFEEWAKAGDIEDGGLDAVNEFRRLFRLSCLDPLAAADLSRVGGARGPSKHRGSVGASDSLHDALRALGGMGSPGGCGVWFVVGCEYSIRQWASREGWRGRPIDTRVAKGILIGAIGQLKEHFGY